MLQMNQQREETLARAAKETAHINSFEQQLALLDAAAALKR